jgi:hypothetical protein
MVRQDERAAQYESGQKNEDESHGGSHAGMKICISTGRRNEIVSKMNSKSGNETCQRMKMKGGFRFEGFRF